MLVEAKSIARPGNANVDAIPASTAGTPTHRKVTSCTPSPYNLPLVLISALTFIAAVFEIIAAAFFHIGMLLLSFASLLLLTDTDSRCK